MKEFNQKIELNDEILSVIPYKAEEILLFDIETTGFSPDNTSLYLIGCIYYKDNSFMLTQWFADTNDSETEILSSFMNLIPNYKALVHYNGSGFDIPYIIRKCKIHNIPCDFSNIRSIDIYKTIQPLKLLFKLENMKQRSLEVFMGYERTDMYSGGELIKIYTEYLANRSEDSLNLLLLHNREDVIGMCHILPVITYGELCYGGYSVDFTEARDSMSSLGIPRKEIYIHLTLNKAVPNRVSYGNAFYYFTIFEKKFTICITAYTEELKYFYQNYKDYYYLPEEDRSIHKSVAFYVDKNYRTRAKAANCYSKKTGVFLPQNEEVITPYFKIDYHDKISYFEYTDEFRKSDEQILLYVSHILKSLLRF